MTWTAWNDASSKAVFARFKDILAPAIARLCPDFLLHHITIDRKTHDYTLQEEVVIRLVLRPIGTAREAPDSADSEANDRLQALIDRRLGRR